MVAPNVQESDGLHGLPSVRPTGLTAPYAIMRSARARWRSRLGHL